MKTLKQLERARDKAEERAYEWHCEYVATLHEFCIPLENGNMLSLYLACNADYEHDRSVADAVEAGKFTVYEEDAYADKNGVYKVCTRRAIARLRYLEKKIKEWNDKSYYLELATEIVQDDGTPYSYCENELAYIARNLAALGVSI